MENQTQLKTSVGEKNQTEKPKSKTLSIKIPRISIPSIQSVILILLIIVGGIQTVQLFGLQKNIASAQIKSSPTASVNTSSAPSSGSGGSSLPTMVGGC